MNQKIQSPEALKHEQVCELGSRLHTALRKCCDSPATTVAYNMIHTLDKEWILWLERVFDAMLVRPAIWLHEEQQDGEVMTRRGGPDRWVRIKSYHDQVIYQRFGDLWPGSEPKGGVDRSFWAEDRYDKGRPCEELYSALCGVVSLFSEDEWKAMCAYVDDDFVKWVQTGE